MKNPSQYSLLLFVLLGSCSGCQKLTTQPTPAQEAPVVACLIATQTTKQLAGPAQQSQLERETVTIGNESFQVSTVKKSVYSYDKQGRILTEYNQYLEANQIRYGGGSTDSVFYQYSPMAVSRRTVAFAESGKRERVDVVALDSRGFAEEQPTTNLATYDKDGYLTTLRDQHGKPIARIDNGNVVEYHFSDSPATPSYIYKYEFDLRRPGLPSVRSFYGKPSRNLPIRYTVDEKSLFGSGKLNALVGTYTYVFNENGSVKRQILRDKENIPIIYGGNDVEVNDFAYLCP